MNASVSSPSDHLTLDSNPLASVQEPSCPEIEAIVTTAPRVVAIEDDEAARMDAEQTPEHVPVDLEDIPVAGDNAVFVVDELVSGNHHGDENAVRRIEQVTSTTHDGDVLTEIHDNEESPAKRRRSNYHPSR